MFDYGFLEGSFQYQYGAIKGNLVDSGLTSLTLFQYQYGAIKGLKSSVIKSWVVDFNTNMVRLKVFIVWVIKLSCQISIPIWCD